MHIRGLQELSRTLPAVFNAFKQKKFTVKKSYRAFSAIAIDQAHEQKNRIVKDSCNAVGLFDKPGALHRRLVAGPEISQILSQYKSTKNFEWDDSESVCHYSENPSIQNQFMKHVKSMVTLFKTEEFGNPFKDEGNDLLSLHSKDIAGPEVQDTVLNIHNIGEEQYKVFIIGCFQTSTCKINDTIAKNNSPLFRNKATRKSINNICRLCQKCLHTLLG